MFHIDISDRTYFELLVALGSLCIFIYANGKGMQQNRLLKNGIRVQGEVIEIKETRWDGTRYGTPSYYPVIRFETSSSTAVTGDYDIFCSNPSAYKLNEKVEVFYDPIDHENFTVNNLSSKLAVAVILIVSSVVFSAAVIFYILDPDSFIRF
ncbi:hypothetical protein A0256_15670 [Mucilaginibacter sp. PAMC 26640]|nr:hypothetical protein A0256_15670 [Mucilaginibacter sp. PAMC 26640]